MLQSVVNRIHPEVVVWWRDYMYVPLRIVEEGGDGMIVTKERWRVTGKKSVS
jgi:hypothetical protein